MAKSSVAIGFADVRSAIPGYAVERRLLAKAPVLILTSINNKKRATRARGEKSGHGWPFWCPPREKVWYRTEPENAAITDDRKTMVGAAG